MTPLAQGRAADATKSPGRDFSKQHLMNMPTPPQGQAASRTCCAHGATTQSPALPSWPGFGSRQGPQHHHHLQPRGLFMPPRVLGWRSSLYQDSAGRDAMTRPDTALGQTPGSIPGHGAARWQTATETLVPRHSAQTAGAPQPSLHVLSAV